MENSMRQPALKKLALTVLFLEPTGPRRAAATSASHARVAPVFDQRQGGLVLTGEL